MSLSYNRLSVTLKDFVEWAIYAKEYTDDGGQIHKKMDLLDVYTAFSQTKSDERANQKGNISKYDFGTVITKENLPCYKVEREGRVSAYLNIIDMKTNKQTTYESRLALAKARNMTEAEVATERSAMEKRTMFDELSREIEEQKREKEEFLQRILSLERKNKRLEEEASEFGEEYEITKEGFVSKLRILEENINQLIEEKNEELE